MALIKRLILMVGFLWLVLAASYFLPLDAFGVRPRSLHGLWGVLFMPFLHGNTVHLMANASGLVVLGFVFAKLHQQSMAWQRLGAIWVLTGLGTWLIGRPGTLHIGASGIVYGLIGYLGTLGFFERRVSTIVLSIFIALTYSGAVWGVLPQANGVSWEGHLCGLLSGVAVARYSGKRLVGS